MMTDTSTVVEEGGVIPSDKVIRHYQSQWASFLLDRELTFVKSVLSGISERFLADGQAAPPVLICSPQGEHTPDRPTAIILAAKKLRPRTLFENGFVPPADGSRSDDPATRNVNLVVSYMHVHRNNLQINIKLKRFYFAFGFC